MTSVEASLLGAISKELAAVLENCQNELRQIEDALEHWRHSGQDPSAFPIGEMQRLDLIYQAQSDLARIVGHTGDVLSSGNQINESTITKLMEVTKLDEVRTRLARAGGTAQPNGSDHNKAVDAPQGSAELF